MSVLQQLHRNDYPSQQKINDEFEQLVTYLQNAERSGTTLPELISKIFDGAANVRSDFVELRVESGEFQYRTALGTWVNLGLNISSLQGPEGPAGPGGGDMASSYWDANSDGKIDFGNLDIPDSSLSQAKVSGLSTALNLRVTAYASNTEPTSPTTTPITLWVDTTTPAQPVLKYYNGSVWQTLGGGTTTSVTQDVANPTFVAGESISSRDLVYLAKVDGYGANQATGGTASGSAGTAANAFDGNDATVFYTSATNGYIVYKKPGNYTVGLVDILFNGDQTLSAALEVSSDGTNWSSVGTIPLATYYGSTGKSQFRIAVPIAGTYFRVRQTGGASQMAIKSLSLYEREVVKGKVYRVNENTVTYRDRSDCVGIALEAKAAGENIKCQFTAGEITGFTGLASGSIIYSSTTSGALTDTPSERSVMVGYAKSSSVLNFLPPKDSREIREAVIFTGALADVPVGTLPMDGRAISREIYADAYAKMGTDHGAGDGQTTFNLPDVRDRFIIGAYQDDSGVAKSNYTGSLAKTGGSRDANVSLGGSGTNFYDATTSPTQPLKVSLDVPFYALAFAVRVY